MIEKLMELALDALFIFVAALTLGLFVYLIEANILSKRFLQRAGFLLLFLATLGAMVWLHIIPKAEHTISLQKLENAIKRWVGQDCECPCDQPKNS